MRLDAKNSLTAAHKNFGRCAAIIKARQSGAQLLSDDENEMLVGLGAARDWIQWASGLNDMTFTSGPSGKSARTAGIVESVRFSQIWTATNALFAKDAILQVIDPSSNPSGSEMDRFKKIYKYASIDPVIEAKSVKTILDLLGMECNAQGVVSVLNPGGIPTMWEVIDQKYSRPVDRARGIGRVISTALEAQDFPNPDGPTIIYGARNWAVHGMLTTKFFRGSRHKFMTFIDHIILLLSVTLEEASHNLRSIL